MSSSRRATLWLSRLVLAAPAVIFSAVSWKFSFHTSENGAYPGMLPSPSNPSLGIISIRAGYGIYPLAFVIVSLFCLLTSQFRAGLSFIAIMMGLLLGVRLINSLNGGAMAENSIVLVAEAVLLVLAVAALVLRSGSAQAAGAPYQEKRT
jgi:hypothetical protein